MYKEALQSTLCEKLYLTKINASFDCDVYFPEISEKFTMTNCFLTTEYDKANKENIEVEYQTYTPYKHYSKS